MNLINGLEIIYSNDDEIDNGWKKIKKEYGWNKLSIQFDHINNNNDDIILKLCIKLKYIGFISLDRLLFCAEYNEEYINKFIKLYEIFVNYNKNLNSKKINMRKDMKLITEEKK